MNTCFNGTLKLLKSLTNILIKLNIIDNGDLSKALNLTTGDVNSVILLVNNSILIKNLTSNPVQLETSTASALIINGLDKIKNDIELSFTTTTDEHAPLNQFTEWQKFTDSSVI